MTREPIYAALLAKLAAAANYNTASRRFKMFTDVAPPDLPALFVLQKDEVAQTVPGMNTVWTIQCEAVIYANVSGDPNVAASSTLNPLLDAVEAALAPSPVTNKQTLGGLVQHCTIAGAIRIDETINGDRMIAVVPIEIKVA